MQLLARISGLPLRRLARRYIRASGQGCGQRCRGRRTNIASHRDPSVCQSAVNIGQNSGSEAAMTVKLYAFTCGAVTGDFARLMDGGEGDITVPIPVCGSAPKWNPFQTALNTLISLRKRATL